MGYVFVYGTLMSGQQNFGVIAPLVVSLEKAYIRGELFHLPQGYPMLCRGDGRVYGELMEISDEMKALQVLDELEDYFGEGHPDNEYERICMPVHDNVGHTKQAWVYRCPIANETHIQAQGRRVPDGDWRRYLNK